MTPPEISAQTQRRCVWRPHDFSAPCRVDGPIPTLSLPRTVTTPEGTET